MSVLFARAGIADGNKEPYEFTDVDRTVAAGLAISRRAYGGGMTTPSAWPAWSTASPACTRRFSMPVAWASWSATACCRIRRRKNRRELVLAFPVFALKVTLDYQLIVNPAYNRDRGPVSVLGFRIHSQY